MELQRIATDYHEEQDRLRLTGEDFQHTTTVLWLTQRLLGRMVPHLCHWLEGQLGNAPLADVRQEMAQQQAQAQLAPQVPVRADAQTPGTLVQSVDIQATSSGVVLVFKGAHAQVLASLRLQATPLRQWLAIVHAQFAQAQWPTTVWPAWVQAVQPITTTDLQHRPVLH